MATAGVGVGSCCPLTCASWTGLRPLGRRFCAHFPRRRGLGHQRRPDRGDGVSRRHAHRIERESGPWRAALLTAPLFAILHFFAKARIAPPTSVGAAASICCSSRSRPWASGAGARFVSVLVGGGIDPEPDRVLTGNIAWRSDCMRVGWCAAHAAGSHRERQLACVLRLGGRFDGLLGYCCCPGHHHRGRLWLTRRTWVLCQGTEVVEPLNGIVEFQTHACRSAESAGFGETVTDPRASSRRMANPS